MYKKLILAFFMLVNAVQLSTAQKNKPCGSSEAENKLMELHPEYKAQIEANAQLLNSIDVSTLKKNRAGNYIIPIVFHIVHNFGPENISDEQVYDAVRRINDDYNILNADLANTIPAYDTLIANCGFEFKLAGKDPDGNCTNGIDRIFSYKTYFGNDQSKINSWNPSRYLNIWVVNSIGQQGAAAYAYKPPSANVIFYWDGVICLYDYVGAIGASNMSHQHTLSHEIGHYLNLDHPWGSTNDPGIACGDDGVGDTPKTRGFNNCTDLYAAICDPLVVENVQNIMEYSYCSTMFTKGQKSRMEIALNSIVGQRSFLWTPQTHVYTGCLLPRPDCAPHAEFKANRQFTCPGNAITLTAKSWGDSLLTHVWDASTGALTSTTGNTTQFSMNTTGWSNISLTSTSNAGAGSMLKEKYIYVADPIGINPAGYVESFVHQNDQDKWPIFNYFDNYFKWQFTSTAGLWGNTCLMYKGYNNRPFPANVTLSAAYDWDDIMTPAYDLTGLTPSNAYLSFWKAAATRAGITGDIDDSLTISYSTNCGNTWVKLKTLTTGELHNCGSYSNVEFVPGNDQLWAPTNIKLPSAALTSSTFFRLRFNPGENSNAVYLDNFMFGNAPTSINELYNSSKQGIRIIPNPSNGNCKIMSTITDGSTVARVKITNTIGEVILEKQVPVSSNGLLDYDYEFSGAASSGIYFISIVTPHTILTEKLILSK